MKKLVVVGSVVLLLANCQTARNAPAAARSPEMSKLLAMLRDPLLWGPGYAEAVALIPGFAEAGEEGVEIRPLQMLGRRVYAARADAELAAGRANVALTVVKRPRIALPGSSRTPVSPPPLAALVAGEDRKLHVATEIQATRFVALNVTIDQVIARFGKPDEVTVVVIDDGTERRPTELTLYHWAGDAILVGTTDINPDPRTVDRILLDTHAVMAVLF